PNEPSARHEVVMESSPFSRVRSLLKYARPAQWTAILTGVTTALLYAALILLLALFVDLLVTRGRIPNFAQLSVAEQRAVLSEWSALPEPERARALQHVGFGENEASGAAGEGPVPDPVTRARVYQDLMGGAGVDFPPVPGAATPEAVREWAARRQYVGD